MVDTQKSILYTGLVISLVALLCMSSKQDEYPSWPSPAYWNGTFDWYHANNASLNDNGVIKFCYDYQENRYGKHYYSLVSGKESSFLFLNQSYYVITNGNCKESNLQYFPFPQNQFEKFINVGQEIVNGQSVYHYVGNTLNYIDGNDSSDQYFSTETGLPAGNIQINIHASGYYEVRRFASFWINQTADDCFKVPSQCS